ncbi:MAG: methyltransferase domain-containing protein [Planctomycetota bacterium]|nr:methyltransferase domain-containing protein [Planctomycetota bacterium]
MNRDVLASWMADTGGPLLELGPGGAPMLARLPDVPNERKHVIEFAGAIEHSRSLGYQCTTQDIGKDAWDFDDDTFDLVVSNHVLEHIPRTDHVLRESFRVRKPGGRVLGSVPNPGALVYIGMLLMTFNPPMSMVSDEYYGLGNPLSRRRFQRSVEFGTEGHGHLRLFTIRGMQDLLRVHGFDVRRCHGGTWGVPLVGRLLAEVLPWYGLFTIVEAEKPRSA